MKFFILGFLHVLFLSGYSFAESDGGMSGGGGGDSPNPPQIQIHEIENVLKVARREIYMALALESQTSTFPWPELFTDSPNIFQFLKEYKIYGEYQDCQDTFGESKDGSIQSPIPKSICISLGRLSKKLNVDNARAQILSLVAHEFSHLKGFDEAKAQALQKWLLPKFANSSSDQSAQLVDYIARKSFDIRDIFNTYTQSSKLELKWDYLCFVSERIRDSLKSIEQLATDKPFSVLDKRIYTHQNSFLIKQIAIATQVCAQSQYHPEKALMQNRVRTWFKDKEILFDSDLKDILISSEYDVRNNLLLLENLPIRRIHNRQDFETELTEVVNYIFDLLTGQITTLWDLEKPILRSTQPQSQKNTF